MSCAMPHPLIPYPIQRTPYPAISSPRSGVIIGDCPKIAPAISVVAVIRCLMRVFAEVGDSLEILAGILCNI